MKTIKNNKRTPASSIAGWALILFSITLFPGSVFAQEGVKRNDLQRHDIGVPGREAVQVRIDFAADALAPRHSHPGEEIIYVLEGSLEYQVDGKPPVTLNAGEVLFIPAGVIHSAKNVGGSNAKELATYLVEKGKPLVVIAK